MHCEGYDYEEIPDEIMQALLSEPFFTRRLKIAMLSRPDGFLFFGKLGVDFFSISDLLYPNKKISLRLISARPDFHMISDNSNVRLGIVECSTHTRCIALMDDYHNKRMVVLPYIFVELDYLQTLPQIFTIPVRQNQFFQQNIFNKAPVPQNPIAMITNSASTGRYTEIPSWYQQLDLRQIRILRGGQPIVDFDAADKCRLYVTTMKAMNFKDVFPSIPIDNFKYHYVLVFDLTSLHDATEHCRNPDLVGQPLRLEPNLLFL